MTTFLFALTAIVGMLLAGCAIALVLEVRAIRRGDDSTISEGSWRVQLRQPWLWFVLAWGISAPSCYVLGHLTWQSTRTYEAIRCEEGGGHMACVPGGRR